MIDYLKIKHANFIYNLIIARDRHKLIEFVSFFLIGLAGNILASEGNLYLVSHIGFYKHISWIFCIKILLILVLALILYLIAEDIRIFLSESEQRFQNNQSQDNYAIFVKNALKEHVFSYCIKFYLSVFFVISLLVLAYAK